MCPEKNCTKEVEICTPTLKSTCEKVELKSEKPKRVDLKYSVVKTVCVETIEVVPYEICAYAYEKKEVETVSIQHSTLTQHLSFF